MLLDDSQGCPGKRTVRGQLFGLCCRCARLDGPKPHIAPAARLERMVVVCDERRAHPVRMLDYVSGPNPTDSRGPLGEPLESVKVAEKVEACES